MKRVRHFTGSRNRSKLACLLILNCGEYLTAGELAAAAGISARYVSKRVNFWLWLELVERRPACRGARLCWEYNITFKGRAFIDEAPYVVRMAVARDLPRVPSFKLGQKNADKGVFSPTQAMSSR